MSEFRDFLRFAFTTPPGIICTIDFLLHLAISICAVYLLLGCFA